MERNEKFVFDYPIAELTLVNANETAEGIKKMTKGAMSKKMNIAWDSDCFYVEMQTDLLTDNEVISIPFGAEIEYGVLKSDYASESLYSMKIRWSIGKAKFELFISKDGDLSLEFFVGNCKYFCNFAKDSDGCPF